MNIVKKSILIVGLPLFLIACGGETKPAEEMENATEEAVEGAEEVMEEAGEAMEEAGEAMEEVADEAGDAMEMTFEEGSWAWNIDDFIKNGEGEKTFELDQLTGQDGDEISAEGNAQLDALAYILKSNPDLNAELQGHSKEAKNEVGRKAKKAASAARALWAKAKLTSRGIAGNRLTTEGYADAMLLEGVDGKDDRQSRISIKFMK